MALITKFCQGLRRQPRGGNPVISRSPRLVTGDKMARDWVMSIQNFGVRGILFYKNACFIGILLWKNFSESNGSAENSFLRFNM